MSEVDELKKNLFKSNKTGWLSADENRLSEIFNYCNDYIDFLNNSKTEREIVETAKRMADERGFKDIREMESLKPGDRIYYINRNKSMYLSVIGNEPIENGLNIIGGHADSPRLDLKPNPLYEDTGLAYLKTHYYGGIKKYQWTTIPLAIHGVFIKENGEKVEVRIGEDDEDPIFTITDLLPHLAREQMQKKSAELINAEDLNLLVGSIPYSDDKTADAVKLNIMKVLNERYGIVEDDFISSEIELVPAFKARSSGLDGSLVAAYGQDDKVCVYSELKAILDIENPQTTCVCIIADKEEIGSVGNTGMQSQVFDTFISEILNGLGVNKPNLLDKVFVNSEMLSADVDAGYDPIYASVFDKRNAGLLGKGVAVNKYTGSGGKYEASDANAEFLAKVRKLFNDNDVKYQLSELGKTDVGGGGTIAYILANKGVDVLDCGIPLLSMHSPYEVTSKFDIYESYRAYSAFYRN